MTTPNIIAAVTICAASLAVITLSAGVGELIEADKIMATCEDANAVTEINGKVYVCLTAREWGAIVKQIRANKP